MPEYEVVKYESLAEGRIVRILLNRPDTRNAQNRGMLVELDDAFRTAEKDDEVRVVILGWGAPQGCRIADAPGVALLLLQYLAVAEPAQDHDRPGAGDRLRSRPHADVG